MYIKEKSRAHVIRTKIKLQMSSSRCVNSDIARFHTLRFVILYVHGELQKCKWSPIMRLLTWIDASFCTRFQSKQLFGDFMQAIQFCSSLWCYNRMQLRYVTTTVTSICQTRGRWGKSFPRLHSHIRFAFNCDLNSWATESGLNFKRLTGNWWKWTLYGTQIAPSWGI